MMKPWLLLPPQLAHDWAPLTLPLWSRLFQENHPVALSRDWQGLHFRNPIGIAGGVDKEAGSALSWQRLGAGFLEVGTITPLPQGPNPGTIIRRNTGQMALWNKMGFPNKGSQTLKNRLQKTRDKITVPLFVNIGKNRQTPNDKAFEDYVQCLEVFQDLADAFVINISSPNTKDLRELQSKESLKRFLSPILEKKETLHIKAPFLIKLSPDSSREDLEHSLVVSRELGLNGWILTNTTKERAPGLESFPQQEGGVSGAPLKSLAEQHLVWANEILGKRKNTELLISVGGILSASDILRRLELGADLVQVYSALVLHGPGFFSKVMPHIRTHVPNDKTLTIN